jgi:hypothetical protein
MRFLAVIYARRGVLRRMEMAHRASSRMSGSISESLSVFDLIDSDSDPDSDREVFTFCFNFRSSNIRAGAHPRA